MRIRLTITAVVAVIMAVAGVTLASAHSKGSRGDDHGARVIKLFAVTVQHHFVDLPPEATPSNPAPSLGDEDVFSDDVFDKKGGTKLGTDGGVCTIVRVEPTSAVAQCAATLSLGGGQIAVQGLVTFPLAEETPPKFDLPITGGTGDFEGASGHITVEELNDTDANITVFLSQEDDD